MLKTVCFVSSPDIIHFTVQFPHSLTRSSGVTEMDDPEGRLGVVGCGATSLYNSSTGETKLTLPSSAIHSLLTSEDESVDDIPSSFPTSGWKQFVILFKRTFLSIIRDGVSLFLQFYLRLVVWLYAYK